MKGRPHQQSILLLEQICIDAALGTLKSESQSVQSITIVNGVARLPALSFIEIGVPELCSIRIRHGPGSFVLQLAELGKMKTTLITITV